MIRVVAHNDIDKDRWDRVVAASGQATICAASWYLDHVSPKWSALILDDYEAVMPLTGRRLMGIDFLVQPPFCQQLGVFSTTAPPDTALITHFLEALPPSFRYIDVNLHEQCAIDTLPGYAVQENTNYVLNLNHPYEVLYKNFAYNTRRNIKKQAADLALTPDFDWKEAIRIFQKNKGAELRDFNTAAQKKLSHVLTLLKQRECLEAYGVTDSRGKLLAAAFFACGWGKKVFLFSATGEAGKEARAMFFLLDRFIRQHENSPLLLDFEGSNTPSLARFYKGFGAEKRSYKRIQKNTLPFWLKWVKK